MRYGAPLPRKRRFRRLRTWWHARRRRRIFARNAHRRFMLARLNHQFTRRTRRTAKGKATIDPVLSARLAEVGITPGRARRLWRGIALKRKDDQMILERLVGARVSVDGSGRMTACVHLGPGLHWIDGTIRMSQKGLTMPQTLIDMLPGRPVRDVVDHHLIPQDATFVADSDDFGRRYVTMASMPMTQRHMMTTEEGLVLETDVEAVDLPRAGASTLGHWAWKLRRAWPDVRRSLSPLKPKGKPAATFLGLQSLSLGALAAYHWKTSHDAHDLLVQTRAMLTGVVAGTIFGAVLAAIFMIRRWPFDAKLMSEHEEWLSDRLDEQLF